MIVKYFRILKWIWIVTVIAFLGFFLADQWQLIITAFSSLSIYTLICASMLIIIGKIGLAANMLAASNSFGININYRDAYCIYNLSQMAKYVPGSIWQFVSRISMLRRRQIAVRLIRDSILAEHFWIIGSSVILAIIFLWQAQSRLISQLLDKAALVPHQNLAAGGTLLAIFILLVMFRKRIFPFIHWAWNLHPPARSLIILPITWLMLSASMFLLLHPFIGDEPNFCYVIGSYCLAYVIGFLVPFAPAGLGVREAVMAFLLLPWIDLETIIFLVAVNRILYFSMEVLMAAFCLVICRRDLMILPCKT